MVCVWLLCACACRSTVGERRPSVPVLCELLQSLASQIDKSALDKEREESRKKLLRFLNSAMD